MNSELAKSLLTLIAGGCLGVAALVLVEALVRNRKSKERPTLADRASGMLVLQHHETASRNIFDRPRCFSSWSSIGVQGRAEADCHACHHSADCQRLSTLKGNG